MAVAVPVRRGHRGSRRCGWEPDGRHTELDEATTGLSGRRDAVARLLDEGDVAPRARAERPGVVVGRAEKAEAVLGDGIPLLARHLARLAPDADRGVGEEALARRRLLPRRVERGVGGPREL